MRRKSPIFGLLLLGSVLTLIWLGFKTWNRRFEAVHLQRHKLIESDELASWGSKVTIQSALACRSDKVWELVQTTGLLIHVAWPLMVFRPVRGQPLPAIWSMGDTIEVNLFAFGLIPLGEHKIVIALIDPERMEIQSRERGLLAQTWNHRITIQPISDDRCLYTDEIELYSGKLTPVISVFASLFYRYRQSRWQRLARGL